MNGLLAYVLSKKFTSETAAEFGAVKGASCEISTVEEHDGLHKITFTWENSLGEKRNTTVTVKDGENIIEWIPGNTYTYGDVVIYQDCFYLCTVTNSDSTWNSNKYKAIGTADANYGIIEDSSYLPSNLTETDRKMYFSIEDECYWLWDGEQWSKQCDSQPLTDEQMNHLLALI